MPIPHPVGKLRLEETEGGGDGLGGGSRGEEFEEDMI